MFLARAPREGLIFFLMRGAWIATLPRLNCRGNFVEANKGDAVSARGWMTPRLNCRGNFVEADGTLLVVLEAEDGLGLTAEATSLRPQKILAHRRQRCPAPRLNCRGNFVEAHDRAPGSMPVPWRLGLTAEATSLRPKATMENVTPIPDASA